MHFQTHALNARTCTHTQTDFKNHLKILSPILLALWWRPCSSCLHALYTKTAVAVGSAVFSLRKDSSFPAALFSSSSVQMHVLCEPSSIVSATRPQFHSSKCKNVGIVRTKTGQHPHCEVSAAMRFSDTQTVHLYPGAREVTSVSSTITMKRKALDS